MRIPIYIVDAFTTEPFKGNPAAVCLLDEPKQEHWMQAVAGEINLSETAFLLPNDQGYSLRWFTPTVEVDLCGHATLASAHILWETGRLSIRETACFDTLSGRLQANWKNGLIELDFPAEPVNPTEPIAALLEGLKEKSLSFVGRNRLDYLVELADAEMVKSLTPDITALAKVPSRGIIVTARGEGEWDFVSRFFAPRDGIPEDPVTGSAHCALGPYWAERLHKTRLEGRQVSERGGTVITEVKGDRVVLSGPAVTVLEGKLC